MKNTDLAATYALIAQYGSDVFYDGEIGEAIIDTLEVPPTVASPPYQVVSGNLTMDDLQSYTVPELAPLHVNYRGYDVYGAPPSSSGGATIGLALNVLEGYDLASVPREEALHYYIEASRHAFADRYAYLGDPLTMTAAMPLTGLLSKNYAELVRQDITELGTERKVSEKDPWLFNDVPQTWQPPLRAPGKDALTEHFTNISNGSSWDNVKWKSASGSGSSIDVQHEMGKLTIGAAKNSYARAAAEMDAVQDSELLVRFKMDELDGDRRLRFWLRADSFNAITSPHNGYGFEINTKDDTVRIIRTRNGNGVYTLATFAHARTTEWQWLRFRVEGDQLHVRVWADGEHEPRQTWSYTMQDQTVTGEGKLLVSGIELTGASTGGSFQVDDLYVTELNPLFFQANFAGMANSVSWDSAGKFITQFGTGNSKPNVGASIDVQNEIGRIQLSKDKNAYARAEAIMGNLYDSELLVKFKMNDLGNDRRLRFWLRSDGFNALSLPPQWLWCGANEWIGSLADFAYEK